MSNDKVVTNDKPTEKVEPIAKAKTVVPAKRTSTLLGKIPAGDKIRLIKHNGKAVYLTIEDALKDHNFNQLKESSKTMLTQGKLITQILAERDAE